MQVTGNPLQSMRRSDNLRTLRSEEYSECHNISFQSCYCDKQCNFYGDCCPKALGITPQERIKLHNDLGLPSRDMFKCGKHDILSEDVYGIYIIADCPDKNATCFHTNDTKDIENILHVTDSKNITYHNAKCAECNGVTQYTYWDASFTLQDVSTCKTIDGNRIDIGDVVNLDAATDVKGILQLGCEIISYPPYGTSVRYCNRHFQNVDNCPTTFLPVQHAMTVYQNAECCSQHLQKECTWQTVSCFKWHDQNTNNNMWDGSSRLDVMPSSVLFRFKKVCMCFIFEAMVIHV